MPPPKLVGGPILVDGEDPAPIVRACVVGAMPRLATRSSFPFVDTTLRWRSAADVVAMCSIAGGTLGAWSHRRRWLGLWVKIDGATWVAMLLIRRLRVESGSWAASSFALATLANVTERACVFMPWGSGLWLCLPKCRHRCAQALPLGRWRRSC